MRVVYLFFIIFLFLLLLPIFIIIAVFLVVLSGWPIFYVQKRVGKDNRVFLLYKFRTMERGAEKKQSMVKKLNEADGPVFKIHDDPRYTAFGKFLSHTGLDELPQLFNVLKGDMALIGPRPLPVYEFNKLKNWQKKRQTLYPGIISPWILNGYHNQTFDDWMKSDIDYAQKKNFLSDAVICGKTCVFLIRLFLRETIQSFGVLQKDRPAGYSKVSHAKK